MPHHCAIVRREEDNLQRRDDRGANEVDQRRDGDAAITLVVRGLRGRRAAVEARRGEVQDADANAAQEVHEEKDDVIADAAEVVPSRVVQTYTKQ